MKGKYLLLINQLMMPFFWLLSYLIPKNKKLFIFGCKDKKLFTGNPKYMFLYVSYSTDVEAYFITKNKEIIRDLNKKKLKTASVIFKRWWLLLRAEYIFIDHTIYDIADFPILLGKFNIVQLYHGTPYKKIELDTKKNHRLYAPIAKIMSPKYCLITCNDYNTLKNYSTAFNNNNVKLLGFPRNDIFFDMEMKKEYSFESLEYLNNFTKVFLYAPTWRDYTSFEPFSEDFFNKINAYCKDKNILFLIKQHPHNQQFEIRNRYKNIVDISKDISDAQELLSRVDLLITDYSSIVFDFVLTNKPIISFIPDYAEYTSKNRETYFDYKDVFPGPFIYNEEDLFEKIAENFDWFDNQNYVDKYVKFKEYFNFYQDKDSAKRIFEYLNRK